MATNKTITMTEFNGTDYDNLYPETKVAQVTDINENYYNRTQTLASNTKTSFGLSSLAVPDEVFQEIGKYKQYWWSAYTDLTREGYNEKRTIYDGVDAYFNVRVKGTQTITIYKGISINQSTGAITLTNAQTVTLNYTNNPTHEIMEGVTQQLASYAPFYCTNLIIQGSISSKIFYVPIGASGASSFSNSTIVYDGTGSEYGSGVGIRHASLVTVGAPAQEVTSEYFIFPAGTTEYIHSTDRNAYPDSATVDGVKYTYLGIPLDNAITSPMVETLSYVGNSGASRSITFSIVPQLVVIVGSTGNLVYDCWVWAEGASHIGRGEQYRYGSIVLSGKTFTMTGHSQSSGYEYLSIPNAAPETYKCFAVGRGA